MTDVAGRGQDQGRSHHRKGRPSAATSSLLADYQDAMRYELRAVLAELAGGVPVAGLLPDLPAVPVRPAIADRIRLWDLAIKIGRELGTEVDVAPALDATPPARRARRSRIDYGGS